MDETMIYDNPLFTEKQRLDFALVRIKELEKANADLYEALSTMQRFFGMDQDSNNQHIFSLAEKALKQTKMVK